MFHKTRMDESCKEGVVLLGKQDQTCMLDKQDQT